MESSTLPTGAPTARGSSRSTGGRRAGALLTAERGPQAVVRGLGRVALVERKGGAIAGVGRRDPRVLVGEAPRGERLAVDGRQTGAQHVVVDPSLTVEIRTVGRHRQPDVELGDGRLQAQ